MSVPAERPRRSSRLLLFACSLLLAGCSRPAPEAPSTDLYLLDLRSEGDALVVGDPINLTRHPGYDNQPCFLPDGNTVLYVSRDGEHSDVHELDLSGRSSRRLTRTSLESEYSPQLIPGSDELSVVRVERGGDQRLLRLDRDGGHPVLVTDLIQEPVGYYAWADTETFAAFLVADPPELVVVDLRRGVVESVASNVGRSIQPIPGTDSISFVHKESPADWWIKRLDVRTGEVFRLVRTVQGREDHAWTPDGIVIMGSGSRLYQARPGPGAGWTPFANLSGAGLRNVSRIAVAPGGERMIVVAETATGR